MEGELKSPSRHTHIVGISLCCLGLHFVPCLRASLPMFIIEVSSYRTLLYLHVYRPCERAILQEPETFPVVCLPWHSGQVGSSFFPHVTRFALEGRRSYTDLMRKLTRSGAVCQMSFHVKNFCIILISPLSLL